MYDPEARIFFRYIWPGNRLVEFNVELDSRSGRAAIYISKGKEGISSFAIIPDKPHTLISVQLRQVSAK